MHDQAWIEYAACRGVDIALFYSVDEADVGEALSYCDRCPVQVPCREFAMTNREHFGVWGGTTEQERRRVFRAQRRRRLPASTPDAA